MSPKNRRLAVQGSAERGGGAAPAQALARLGLVVMLLWGLSTCAPDRARAAADLFYFPQAGTPVNIGNFVQPEAGCAWTGVGGQVFDVNGAPVNGLVVKLSGAFGNQSILRYAVSGSSQQFGEGGFDLYLSDSPMVANTLSVQLIDISGAAQSQPVMILTSNLCSANLVVINFRQVDLSRALFLPLVRK